MIPLTRPVLPHTNIMKNYLRQIWKNGWVTNNGEFLQEFEKQLCSSLHCKNIITTCNATLALIIVLRGFRVTGEVITTPFTFPATVNAIIWERLVPVFADIDPETWNLDPNLVEEKINRDTGAIIPVHVFGNPCYPEQFDAMRRKGTRVIFDAAHAFLSDALANYGDASIYSFHATKVFNTMEGGCITTSDARVAEMLGVMRNHGIVDEENVITAGINAKLTEFQACVGLENLRTIRQDIKKRKELYSLYKRGLKDTVCFQKLETDNYNYAYMPVLFENNSKRDKTYKLLKKNGIGARKYFYPPVTDFAYVKERLGMWERFPIASDISYRILCLPLYPDLDKKEVEKIISLIV